MEDTRRDLHNDDLNSLVPDVRVDRRGFVAACLAAGFAVSAEPVLAQAIKTPMDGLDGGDTKIGDMPAYYAVTRAQTPTRWASPAFAAAAAPCGCTTRTSPRSTRASPGTAR